MASLWPPDSVNPGTFAATWLCSRVKVGMTVRFRPRLSAHVDSQPEKTMQDYEKKITLEEIKKAAEWAKEASEPKPIDGTTRKYDQSNWDCGTSCCMWGAASIATGNGPASSGPTPEWSAQSHLHVCVAGLLNSGNSSPEQVIELLRGADLRGANVSIGNVTWRL